MPDATRCCVPDCRRDAYCRSWCRMHYSRWQRHGDPLKVTRTYRGVGGKHLGLTERLWLKIEKAPDGCWRWTGAVGANGYGRIQVDGSTEYAHRVVYELLVEPIPGGLTIDHLCRNRACVNPAHLEPVTMTENIQRAAAIITHCPQGHPYNEANTYVFVDKAKGYRRRTCRICRKAARARFDARHAA